VAAGVLAPWRQAVQSSRAIACAGVGPRLSAEAVPGSCPGSQPAVQRVHAATRLAAGDRRSACAVSVWRLGRAGASAAMARAACDGAWASGASPSHPGHCSSAPRRFAQQFSARAGLSAAGTVVPAACQARCAGRGRCRPVAGRLPASGHRPRTAAARPPGSLAARAALQQRLRDIGPAGAQLHRPCADAPVPPGPGRTSRSSPSRLKGCAPGRRRRTGSRACSERGPGRAVRRGGKACGAPGALGPAAGGCGCSGRCARRSNKACSAASGGVAGGGWSAKSNIGENSEQAW
jgi:hypothetical protein